MSRLAAELRQCMSDLADAGAGKLTARFLFPPGFVGFQGHFPARSVLPAVCTIQAAVAMLEAWAGRAVRLREIVLAKFTSIVTSDEELDFVCDVTTETEGRAVIRATVTRKHEMIAKFRLKVSIDDERAGA
jgi:3-hydroxyacyl-[acyl-carrier-protein] dehydratase